MDVRVSGVVSAVLCASVMAEVSTRCELTNFYSQLMHLCQGGFRDSVGRAGTEQLTQRDWGGESLDKEKKLPFSSLRRFIWSAAGFWEGPLLLPCSSPLLLRSHLFTVSFLLCPSSPSLRSRLLFCPSRFSLVFPPILFPIVARAPLSASPSFFPSLPLLSVGNLREGKRVDVESEVMLGTWLEIAKKGRAMYLQQLCIRSLSLLLLTWCNPVGFSRRKSIFISGKARQQASLSPSFCSHWKWNAFRTTLPRLLFLCSVNAAHRTKTNYEAGLPSHTPLPVHSEGVKVESGKVSKLLHLVCCFKEWKKNL